MRAWPEGAGFDWAYGEDGDENGGDNDGYYRNDDGEQDSDEEDGDDYSQDADEQSNNPQLALRTMCDVGTMFSPHQAFLNFRSIRTS